MSHRSWFRPPGRRLAAVGAAAVVTAGLVASVGVVWQASYSAFSTKTTTPTNNWTAGTVDLTNNRTGAALWNVTNLKPGLTETKCITVTSSGNLPSAVRLYTTSGSATSTNSLSSAIDLTVEQGSFSGGSNCVNHFNRDTGGTIWGNLNMYSFGVYNTNFANSVGSWTTTGAASETKVYRFTWSFDPQYSQAAVDAYQGATAAIGFTWEAQNT